MAKPSQNVKAIIFDWGGVCCKAAEPFASHSLQKALGMDPDTIAARVRDLYNAYYVGKMGSGQFWPAVLAHFGLTGKGEINPKHLAAAYLSSYQEYPEVMGLIKKLKAKFKLGLLSNLTPEMREHIKQEHRLADLFDVQLYSCDPEVAAMKPDVKPYRIMLQKLAVPAPQCLFIDDSPKNLATAAGLGMQTLLFIDPRLFLVEMASRLGI